MTPTTREPPLPEPSGLERSLSPVDLPGDAEDDPGALRWMTSAIGAAAVVLLALNATAIRGWAYELPPGPLTTPVVAAAEGWYGVTAGLGLAVPVETMRGGWRDAQAARFAGDEDQR